MPLAPITPNQFALLRALFGLYLLIHFLGLFPVGVELFSNEGMIADPSLQPTWGLVPNLFWIGDDPFMVYGVLSLGVGLSIALALGWKRRVVSLGLWIVWMSLFNRNILISNPSLPFVGLILLVLSALPSGEPKAMDEPRADWGIPVWVYWGLLIALMGGYTASGLHKLSSPSWLEGLALRHVLELPIARDYFLRDIMLALPDPIIKGMSWGALGMEILALPLTLIRPTRRWIWLGLLSMNVGILFVIDFADLTFGVLMMHAFCFHQGWLPPAKLKSEHPVVFFDGVCSLCNHAVDFLIAEDHNQRYHFASIQGETAQALDNTDVQEGKTMALYDDSQLHIKSEAVLRAAAGLGGHWRIVSWLRVVPRPIRDAVYMQVSKNRYNIFGKRDSCRMPTADERARFLS